MDKNGNSLAIASVPCQKWKSTYDPQTALKKGTVFPELNLPFSRRMTRMRFRPEREAQMERTRSRRREKRLWPKSTKPALW